MLETDKDFDETMKGLEEIMEPNDMSEREISVVESALWDYDVAVSEKIKEDTSRGREISSGLKILKHETSRLRENFPRDYTVSNPILKKELSETRAKNKKLIALLETVLQKVQGGLCEKNRMYNDCTHIDKTKETCDDCDFYTSSLYLQKKIIDSIKKEIKK